MHSEIVLLLDMSGSMASIHAETVKGVNKFIREQKKVEGTATISLVTFNSLRTENIYTNRDLAKVGPIKKTDFRPDGMTPLLDAMGTQIKALEKRLKTLKRKVNSVVFCVMTDGQENNSREFTRDKINRLITRLQKKNGWIFIYLGANQDAFHEAGSLGIDPRYTKPWEASKVGTMSAYTAMSCEAVGARAEGAFLPESISGAKNENKKSNKKAVGQKT